MLAQWHGLAQARGDRTALIQRLPQVGGLNLRLVRQDGVLHSLFRRAAVGCYDVPAGGELWRLLLVLALNKVRGLAIYHRADKRSVSHTVSTQGMEGALHRSADADPQPVQILDMVVSELLDKLPAPQRQMIELRIEGRAVSEIAEITQRAKRTVERVLQSFREDLAKLIDAGQNESER